MNSACLEYVHSASKLSGIALRVSIFQYRGFESHRGHQHLTRNTADHGVFWINVRRQVLLFNIATVVTVVIGVTVLYAALYLLGASCGVLVVVPQVFTGAVGHPPSPPGLLRTSLVDLLFGDDRGCPGCGSGD